MNNVNYISDKIISGTDRRSIPKMTIYERARIIGFRAEQIANGSDSKLSEIPMSILNDPLKIAEEEFRLNLLADYKIYREVRIFGETHYEIVHLGETPEVYIPRV